MSQPSPPPARDEAAPDDPETRPLLRFRPNKPARRVQRGFPWIFADQVVLDRRTRKLPAGSLVTVQAADGTVLGVAGFNAESRIVARMLDRDAAQPIDTAWFRARIARALALRETLFDAPFYRLVHAEGDGLPGVIIDRFGAVAAVQPNAAWADRLYNRLREALVDVTGVETVVMNGTGRARALEGLPAETRLWGRPLQGPVPVPMNGATYMADLLQGQKTGLFYDQRDNHALAARLARGRSVLDVFCHVGGFGLAALAAGAERAEAVDSSAPALELARRGAEAGGVSERFAARRGDAFAVMAEMAEAQRRFGLVACDPPAFAPNRAAREAGLRAYEKVARLAAPLVEPGGFLVLCSCSHAVDEGAFLAASLAGIGRTGRQAQLLHRGQAAPDHPLHPALAETGYLKALFFRLD